MFLEICLVTAATVLYWFRSLFQECNKPALPELYFKSESSFVNDIIQHAVILRMPYMTPLLWGRSGHWQTVAYGILGHRRSGRWMPQGTRMSVQCKDGATISFDVFEPLTRHWTSEDLTFLICPGIANSSESVYVRSFVHYAQGCGFRCVVLNHLGVVDSVKLTSARLFSYGGTVEFAAMVDFIRERYPATTAVALGFSMGANVVTCYLGESEENRKKVLCGISVCQGYDIIRTRPLLLQWQQLRRAYMYRMTCNMKRIFSRNREILFSEEVLKSYPAINVDGVFRATTLSEIDEHYTRVILGFDNLDDMYQQQSCCHRVKQIDIPMLFVNAKDDPIVPTSLLDCIQEYAQKHEKALAVVTRHGGHLGFFEGDSYFVPEPVSWLCRLVAQYTDAVFTRSVVNETWIANNSADSGVSDSNTSDIHINNDSMKQLYTSSSLNNTTDIDLHLHSQ